MTTEFRIETDSMGEVKSPDECLVSSANSARYR